MIKPLRRAKELASNGVELDGSGPLRFFLYSKNENADGDQMLDQFAQLDDHDIWMALKIWSKSSPDRVLQILSESLLDRRLFRLEFSTVPFSGDVLAAVREQIAGQYEISEKETSWLVFDGQESNLTYQTRREQIRILFKNGRVVPISEIAEISIQSRTVTKHFLCSPKIL